MVRSPKTPILIAGGVLAGAVVAAGALSAGNALAEKSTPSPSASYGGRGADAGPGGPGRGGMHRGLGGLPHALHGEFVVPDDDGSGTTTMLTQRGEVTAKSGSTVTVKSTDGFSLTWTLNDDTRIRSGFEQGTAADLAVGDQVVAFGPKAGGGATATVIAEPPTGKDGAPGWRGHRWGEDREDRRDGPPSPSPSSSSSTRSSSFDA